jgi:hypothetical protein
MPIALLQYQSAYTELPNVRYTGHTNQAISQTLELEIPGHSSYLPQLGGANLALYRSSMHLV